MRISDWSSDVCSSDLLSPVFREEPCDESKLQISKDWRSQDGLDLPLISTLNKRAPTSPSTSKFSNSDLMQLFSVPSSNTSSVVASRSEERRVGKECVSNCRSRC